MYYKTSRSESQKHIHIRAQNMYRSWFVPTISLRTSRSVISFFGSHNFYKTPFKKRRPWKNLEKPTRRDFSYLSIFSPLYIWQNDLSSDSQPLRYLEQHFSELVCTRQQLQPIQPLRHSDSMEDAEWDEAKTWWTLSLERFQPKLSLLSKRLWRNIRRQWIRREPLEHNQLKLR